MLFIPKYPDMLDCMSQADSSSVLVPPHDPGPASSCLQATKPSLVLASGSVIRAGLLRDAGLCIEVIAPAVDEGALKRAALQARIPADKTASRLALAKARHVSGSRPDALVIGADQILVCEQRWFDKPKNLGQARSHLLSLRGRSHSLYTAVCVQRNDRTIWSHVAEPALTMRAFSDGMLDAYLALEGDRLLGSVGAYRLEGPGVHLFDRIEGEHAAILGLPMLALLACLRQQGVLLA